MVKESAKRIFISYARGDGSDLALRLEADLKSAGFYVWMDTKRLQSGTSWTVEIEREIDRAHLLLAILTPGSNNSSICRAEQLRALRKKRAVIPLKGHVNADFPLHLESVSYRDFSSPTRYKSQLRYLLGDIKSGKTAAVKLGFQSPLVTAPPFPRNYMPRPEALRALREVVITDDPGPSIALTALRGMGGIGKTVLAQALSHDEAVQEAFPDGIAWITLGKEPIYDLKTRLQEVRRVLGDEPSVGETELHSIDRYRTVLREKAALIILDDVWRSDDVAPFLADSARSQVLFTTRDENIANATGARLHKADLLTLQQSRELLARWAGLEVGNLPPEGTDLIRECGRLPLALSMIGAMLREKPLTRWTQVLNLLRQADIEKIRAPFTSYPHKDLLRAIQVSVDSLEGTDRQRYVALAVLLDDMTAAPAVQQALWNVSHNEAIETADRFVGLSLAQRDGADGGIRLHDLQLDWARARWGERSALELIRSAVRLSSHVMEGDPAQFASQIVGRLLPHSGVAVIDRWIDGVITAAPKPWLRPLWPALDPPDTGLLRTLAGHSAAVTSVAVTRDRKVISASWDTTLRVWDLDSGRHLRTLEGHSDWINCVAVTGDGKRAVSGADDCTLKIWDIDTGRALRTLKGHVTPVHGVAVTKDGKIVSLSGDHELRVWDLESGRQQPILSPACGYGKPHSLTIYGIAVAADGKQVIFASGDRTLSVRDLENGSELHSLVHSSAVQGVATVTEDGKIVSGALWGNLTVWDLETGRKLRTLEGRGGKAVYSIAVMADGKRVVSASDDRTLTIWDLESGRELRVLEGHSAWVNGVAATLDAKVVSASGDKTLKVWDLENHRETSRRLEGHHGPVICLAVLRHGRVLSLSDNELKVWDMVEGRGGVTRTLPWRWGNAIAVTSDGKVVSGHGQAIKVWDFESGRQFWELTGHSSTVYAIALTADGRVAISASSDKTLKVWSLKNGHELHTLKGHTDSVSGVAVMAGKVVSASYDNTLRIWDLCSGRQLHTLQGHSASVTSVALTTDKKVVSASYDSSLKIWNLDSGQQLQTLHGHSATVNGVAVTADGKQAVSVSRDMTVKVWDLQTGRTSATFTCDAEVNCVLAAGGTITAGDERGRVYFLSLVS